MVPPPDDQPVTLRDAQTARRIARAALKGGPAERRPTREQLLSAFDETEADADGVRRVEAALRMAGVEMPDGRLGAAAPGDRIELQVSPVDPGGSGSALRRGELVAGAIAMLVAAVAGASTLVGSSVDDGGDRVADALPATATSTVDAEATTGPSGPAGDPTGATGPTGASSEEQEAREAKERAAERRRAAERKRAADRRAARRKREARRRAAARRLVTVRLTPAGATFLCADDGAGKILFNGTLSSPRTFKGRRVRLNVGLASTKVTINGRPYTLTGSPAGVDITRKGASPLALGSRPAC
jgi:hypothetical protein